MDSLKILSSPETAPYWVSPLYRQDSLEKMASLVWDIIDEGESNSLNSEYCLLDIGGGSGLFAEEVAVNYPESNENDSMEVLAEMLDMAPPEHAEELSRSQDNINVIQGRAPEDIPLREYDFISLINTGQYFDDEEFPDLVDEIYGSLRPGGHFMFNSTYGIVDLFSELEEFADRELVSYKEGDVTVGAEVRIDNEEFDMGGLGISEPIEAEVSQSPRKFGDYILEILGADQEDERFRGERFGVVDAFTDAESLMKCIESISYDETDERFEHVKDRVIRYPWGIVKKTPDYRAPEGRKL